ncbi:hypothetical protein CYMTET_6369 [Cymbomonas tetramitiformis]|uniref:Uncharacterized protein n=1 Tax=Cymbomonas tetramitiformis TaxID=36881 RepID=A0AAE0LI51_9CHLO|nr:hypothetical protein CYMTET_6369 [Cymbomonas tetramitiformis]
MPRRDLGLLPFVPYSVFQNLIEGEPLFDPEKDIEIPKEDALLRALEERVDELQTVRTELKAEKEELETRARELQYGLNECTGILTVLTKPDVVICTEVELKRLIKKAVEDSRQSPERTVEELVTSSTEAALPILGVAPNDVDRAVCGNDADSIDTPVVLLSPVLEKLKGGRLNARLVFMRARAHTYA